MSIIQFIHTNPNLSDAQKQAVWEKTLNLMMSGDPLLKAMVDQYVLTLDYEGFMKMVFQNEYLRIRTPTDLL